MSYQHMGIYSSSNTPLHEREGVRKYAVIRDDGSCTVYKDGDGTDPQATLSPQNYDFWVDGYPVTYELKKYADALRKGNRHLKFTPFGLGRNNRTAVRTINNALLGTIYVFTQLSVYMDDCDYLLGQIGYGDYSIKKTTRYGAIIDDPKPPKYMVFSRLIKNEKVNNDRDQFNMFMSEKLDRIVPKALANLRAYLPHEYTAMTIGQFAHRVQGEVKNIIDDSTRVINKCGSYSVLETEIRHLIKMGVEFVTPEFKRAAAEFLALDAEAQGAKLRKVGAYYIRVFTDYRGEQMCSVSTYNSNFAQDARGPRTADECVAIKMTDLPDDVQLKLATLSMLTDDSYVAGTGMRVSGNRYWVERDL